MGKELGMGGERLRERVTIEANGLRFGLVDRGAGRPVLLLHGFPDSADLWRNQVPALADAGFRVIAPDLRGMGSSDAPAATDAYTNQHFFGDLTGILDALGVDQVDVVGHDVGAGFAWGMAALMPERVRRLAALSVGHPAGYWGDGMEQREKSWYMWFLRFEGFADDMLRRDDWALFRAWTNGARDQERYVADLSRPGRLAAGLAWYRGRQSLEFLIDGAAAMPDVTCPTLGVWGARDTYCLEPQMLASADRVRGPWRYERIEDAGHWIPLDAPDLLTDLLLDFLEPASVG